MNEAQRDKQQLLQKAAFVARERSELESVMLLANSSGASTKYASSSMFSFSRNAPIPQMPSRYSHLNTKIIDYPPNFTDSALISLRSMGLVFCGAILVILTFLLVIDKLIF